MKNPSLSNHFSESQDAQVIGREVASDNKIVNPFLDSDNAYPTGNGYIGGTAGMPDGWVIYSPIYLDSNTNDYTVACPTAFHENHKPFLDTLIDAEVQKRCVKLFGVGTSFNSRNTVPGRTYPNPPISCNTSDGTVVDGSAAFGSTDIWARTDFGQRSISVPNAATTATMQVFVRVPSDDKFRDLNFGGAYMFSTTTQDSQTSGTVSYFAVKNSSHSLTLEDNPSSGQQSNFNWCGFSHTGTSQFTTRWIENLTVDSNDYYDSEDFSEFKKITLTMTLPSGTDRELGFALYFAENHSYLPITPPDPNPLSGSIYFYQPHIAFDAEDPTATLVLKHTGYGSGRITIGGTTLNYSGTAGTNFPNPITSTDAFEATFRAIGTDANFRTNPTITGGSYTGEIANAEDGDLQITWDGVSSEIVITTDGFKD